MTCIHVYIYDMYTCICIYIYHYTVYVYCTKNLFIRLSVHHHCSPWDRLTCLSEKSRQFNQGWSDLLVGSNAFLEFILSVATPGFFPRGQLVCLFHVWSRIRGGRAVQSLELAVLSTMQSCLRFLWNNSIDSTLGASEFRTWKIPFPHVEGPIHLSGKSFQTMGMSVGWDMRPSPKRWPWEKVDGKD